MISHDDGPVTLITVLTEQEAAIIVASLADNGITARAVGDLTAGFRAEAPGSVQVLIKSSDLARAQEVLNTNEPASAPPQIEPEILEEEYVEPNVKSIETWREAVRILVLLGLTIVAVWILYLLITTFGRE